MIKKIITTKHHSPTFQREGDHPSDKKALNLKLFLCLLACPLNKTHRIMNFVNIYWMEFPSS